MKTIITLFCLLPVLLFGQDTLTTKAPVERDTTIYSIADEIPRFPTNCERYDTTAAAKAQCSEKALLSYVNQRIIYPAKAREENVSGMAVVSFIVEASGYISNAKVLKDPGGDIGMAALQAVISMAREVRFRPAVIDTSFVRYDYVLPIRFRLEDPKPYVLVDRDTIYTELTKPLRFLANDGKLGEYLSKQIKYPASGEDSCRTGQMDIQLLVHPNGRVDVQDVIDYNDLGTDFTFEAMHVATKSIGQWEPGEFNGRPVTSAYDVSFSFAPTSEGCQSVIATYNEAIELMNQGQQMTSDTLTLSDGLAKMDRAVALFPKDGRFRILRGQTRMNNNMLGGACEDLTLAKQIALIDWYDNVLPLICRQLEEEE
jgi:TonB family protein